MKAKQQEEHQGVIFNILLLNVNCLLELKRNVKINLVNIYLKWHILFAIIQIIH